MGGDGVICLHGWLATTKSLQDLQKTRLGKEDVMKAWANKN